ncbi:phosphoribosylglycinamide formyltransferase [Thiocystis minor]|uniref:phosphoribosylglycinamide formyltransferase n=1 Tax=Thiocystis minor TaxID=61597 RepID=UPI0019132510|nr:phosphoribosylglycinamide formyltransferase [Thiocystis minor]MBK5963820.1 phosphoribosylglycinamide formyltransferase [Thiocystis minor]
MPEDKRLKIVALISGGGSNLQALIDAQRQGLPIRIVAVVSNRADAPGLERARRHGIPSEILGHGDYSNRHAYDEDLKRLIDRYDPGLVILAGFMRILTPEFVTHYHGRMLNIHPSLLPKFRGLHTHQRVLDAGETRHGASVHFVTAELDGGPVILQAEVPVLPQDDSATLAARVLEQEHLIYPAVVRWFAEGRLEFGEDGRPWLDGKPMEKPCLI